MYKLIAIDCDGTLLNSKKEISHRTIAAIKNAKDNDVKVVLATARPFYRIKKYLKQLDLISDDQYTICFNGGMVINNTETETIFFRCFSKKHTYELIKTGLKFNTKIFIYTSDQIYANRDDKLYRKINPDTVFEVVDFDNINFSEKIVRKVVYYGNPKSISKIRDNLPESLLSQFEISSSVPENIEFVKKGVSKAKGLQKIAKKLDIKLSEIIAFGDHENDLKMMEFAGHSVAMGNAIDEIKSISDETTDTSDNDGVAQVLGRIFS
jgi:Cof subfamily protein (haloacid dehalogenase superfamily)